jgi:glycogen debranching enzyme GlgX
MQPSQIQEGRAFPLGATVRDGGVNFALASEHARMVELCLFDEAGKVQQHCVALPGHTHGVFHGFVPGCEAGTVYGYRVHGDYAPQHGHRFNPRKLLLDPYAREIAGQFQWVDAQLGYDARHPHGHRPRSETDNADIALKARVAGELSATAVGAAHVPARDMLLYELHVKGFSRLNLEVPEALRGTYAGLAHPASLQHFKRLGVTSVCLLPVHYHIDEAALVRRGLTNYWGYNTIGFFCPSPRLASHKDPSAVNREFRAMVQALHAAGLEVILDVVFNHTAEADESGPTISFRGIDNAMYYRLPGNDRSRYENLTGCGNTMNIAHPRVAQLVLDSMRYWVSEMGVDGFRFDLAPVLGRNAHGFDSHAAFFQLLAQDPILERAKLIAEPWDLGPGGYQLGHFPGRFMEWNDKFRDTTRRFWLHRGVSRGEFARRFMASSDVFHRGQRKPSASINYICSHDGYTLHDALAYSRKHNTANGEDNRDGRNGEISHNHGLEGTGANVDVEQARQHMARTLLANLLLAHGIPMLRAGDELGQSQRGNNNAYCQDNEISWIDWTQSDQSLAGFAARVIALRKAHTLLRHDHWFTGRSAPGQPPDVQWFLPDGASMTIDAWQDNAHQAFAVLMCLQTHAEPMLWIGLNGDAQPVQFALPAGRWRCEIDSSNPESTASYVQDRLDIPARTLLVLAQLM